MKNLFNQSAKVDIKVIFRNGSSFEYTHYGLVEDLLEDTQYLRQATGEDWTAEELYHFGNWSFDLSKAMAVFIGDITPTNDGSEVKFC